MTEYDKTFREAVEEIREQRENGDYGTVYYVPKHHDEILSREGTISVNFSACAPWLEVSGDDRRSLIPIESVSWIDYYEPSDKQQ